MPEKRQYQIRQAILTDLKDVYPGGKNTEDLRKVTALTNLSVSEGNLIEQLNVLLAGGYVKNVLEKRGDAYWKITSSGLFQIRKECVLDEIVWGVDAL